MRHAILALAFHTISVLTALAQPTAFSYQGELTDGGQPAGGAYDLRFRLYDAALGGNQIGGTMCVDDVQVIGGRFAALVDFGSAFNGQARYLEIDVRPGAGLDCSTSAGFTTLGARQAITSTPVSTYAVRAANADFASNAAALNGQAASFYSNAGNLTGTLSDTRLSANIAKLNTPSTFTAAPSFSGGISGSTPPFAVTSNFRVSNLNSDLLDGLDSSAFSLSGHTHDAAAISTGTLADARLPATVARLASMNTFTAAQTISTAAATPLQVSSSSTGGTWMNLVNSAASGHAWNLISSGTGNSEGAGKLLLRDQTAGAVRMTLDTGGNIGIGTSSPAAPLDVQVAVGQSLQFRLDSFVPGIKVNNTGGNAGILRLRNAMEVWPAMTVRGPGGWMSATPPAPPP